jgi:hypothetical protein
MVDAGCQVYDVDPALECLSEKEYPLYSCHNVVNAAITNEVSLLIILHLKQSEFFLPAFPQWIPQESFHLMDQFALFLARVSSYSLLVSYSIKIGTFEVFKEAERDHMQPHLCARCRTFENLSVGTIVENA